jgi:hypothetical protein
MTNDLVISGTRSLNQLECSKPNYEQIASEFFCWLYIYMLQAVIMLHISFSQCFKISGSLPKNKTTEQRYFIGLKKI